MPLFQLSFSLGFVRLHCGHGALPLSLTGGSGALNMVRYHPAFRELLLGRGRGNPGVSNWERRIQER